MLSIFFAFVKKEILHILRDVRTLLILFGMPVALVLIFGYTVSNEFRGASLGVYDAAKDELSQALVDHITSSGHFQLVNLSEDINAVDKAFKAGVISVAIIIPPAFEQQFLSDKKTSIQVITDATEPNYATTLTSYASSMITSFQQMYNKGRGQFFQIQVETQLYYNPLLIGAYNFVPGVVALILMLTCAMMTSLTIAREKELGTMNLLLISPLPPLLIILGKVTPYSVLSFLSALLVFAMGYYIFDVPILGSLPLLLSLCLLYLLVALALGVLISTRAESQQVAMMTSMFSLMLPTMLLSGFLFPIASMPVFLQYISTVIPATYFIQIEKAIMLKGAGWEFVYPSAAVLLLMLFVLLTAAWRNFKVISK